jgi:HAD superfamily hydrolase (TIGR01490 family)
VAGERVTASAPTRLVFSDVDETLIKTKSMFDFLDFYLVGRDGSAGAARAAAIGRELASLIADGAPREQANRAYYRALAGESADELDDWGRRWFAERSAGANPGNDISAITDKGFYIPETLNALLAHRADGAQLVLVSGSFPALLRPIAAEVGATRLLCTRPAEQDGRLTGELTGEPVIGPGKRAAVRGLLEKYPHIDPADCYAYGDHLSDLPMLAEVGHPVVVGRDPDLIGALPDAYILAT